MKVEPDAISLFPLANVVVFPRTRVPLHVFEPRYRQMTRDALEGERRIGMVAVHPEHVDQMPGDPPVFEIGCEGRIERAEPLVDGRYNLVLLGTKRFRILAEPPRPAERLYRIAQVEPLDDPVGDSQLISGQRDEITELVRRWLDQAAPERVASRVPQAVEGVDDPTFVNSLAVSLAFDAVEKQALLEANSVSERCTALAGLIRFRLAELASPGASEPGPMH